ncbi:hypothetical protein P3C61_15840, partial [Pseudomonas aeruginosa]
VQDLLGHSDVSTTPALRRGTAGGGAVALNSLLGLGPADTTKLEAHNEPQNRKKEHDQLAHGTAPRNYDLTGHAVHWQRPRIRRK